MTSRVEVYFDENGKVISGDASKIVRCEYDFSTSTYTVIGKSGANMSNAKAYFPPPEGTVVKFSSEATAVNYDAAGSRSEGAVVKLSLRSSVAENYSSYMGIRSPWILCFDATP
jgi:hypothetical protein